MSQTQIIYHRISQAINRQDRDAFTVTKPSGYQRTESERMGVRLTLMQDRVELTDMESGACWIWDHNGKNVIRSCHPNDVGVGRLETLFWVLLIAMEEVQ